jgi:hypothetical protein
MFDCSLLRELEEHDSHETFIQRRVSLNYINKDDLLRILWDEIQKYWIQQIGKGCETNATISSHEHNVVVVNEKYIHEVEIEFMIHEKLL